VSQTLEIESRKNLIRLELGGIFSQLHLFCTPMPDVKIHLGQQVFHHLFHFHSMVIQLSNAFFSLTQLIELIPLLTPADMI
jgi:hypothetical protein